MPVLTFENLPGSWRGNDYPSVSITSVKLNAAPVAFVFMTHMNVDYDGAPNAYGPAEKTPLDNLANAGQNGGNGYYGLMAVGPDEKVANGQKLIKDVYNLKLDPRYPDTKGRVPVVQKDGTYAGYFVSTTAKRNPSGSPSRFEQSHYLDSSAVAFSALSYNFHQQGVGDGDLGIAIRHDKFKYTTFAYMGGEGAGKGSKSAGAVGECSYKVFLDIGGSPKTAAQRYVNNNFPTSFIVFPGSKTSQLVRLSLAENALDFAAFLALQAQTDAHHRGTSGLPAFNHWVAEGRVSKPPKFDDILLVLMSSGYSLALSIAATAASGVASGLSSAARLIP